MPIATHRAGPFVHVTVPSSIAEITISDLVCRRGVEGPQIILTWTKPYKYSELSDIRIVRKMGGFPINETDGKIVLNTINTQLEYYTDFPKYGPEYFYYKFFHKWGTRWISTPLTECVELAHDTRIEWKDKFYKELPELYRAWDKKKFGSNQVILESSDLDINEKILLAEDGKTEQGELQRFLKLFNTFFNELLALTRAIGTRNGLGIVHDIRRTKPKYLDFISKLFGWNFNYDLPTIAGRNEVISLPDIYRQKGRADITEAFISNILLGHTVDLILCNQVLGWNDYPLGSLLDCTDIVKEVNYLTKNNLIYVILDLSGESSIGFNQIAVNIVPATNLMVRASNIKKLENITEDFFSILDRVFIIIHQTYTLNFPTDFTTAGVTRINLLLALGYTYLQLFDWYELGIGQDKWDYGLTPIPAIGDSVLVNPQFRNIPRNIVYADGSWNPTVTPGKKVLIRCFEDLERFTSLYSREVGIFSGGSSTIGSGTLLAERFFPLRFIDNQVRNIIDFRIQFP